MITTKRTKKEGRLITVKLDYDIRGHTTDRDIVETRPEWKNPHCYVRNHGYGWGCWLRGKTYHFKVA